MKVETKTHDDGTLIINYVAECKQDKIANAALFARYDGTGLVGSASGDGSYIQLLVSPLTPEEIATNKWADGFISSMNGVSRPSVVLEAGSQNTTLALAAG